MRIVKGTVLEAADDVAVTGLVHWRAPMTSGFNGVPPEGTLIEVLDDPLPGAAATYCRPIDYDRLEEILVPEEDRSAFKYDGYTIVLPLAEIDHAWRRIER